MLRHRLVMLATTVAAACGGSQPAAEVASSEPAAQPAAPAQDAPTQGGEEPGRESEFRLSPSQDAEHAHGERPSEIRATATHAAMRLFVVDPEAGPIAGVVVKLTAPDGSVYYTRETDSHGYAEVLVPAGQRYEIEYLSLGRRNTTASVNVPEGPNQDIRLTMRYRRRRPQGESAGIVLDGVLFASGSARLDPASYPRLDRVVEYMRHLPRTRIRIEGHTDNVGNPQRNLRLSEARARAVRDYLVARGIDGSRIEAVGFGDQRPIAPNDTEEGRRQNRRIEAYEL